MNEAETQHFWRDRRVFVTGATGLVGAALVRRLVEAKSDVVCLIRDWVPRSELVLSHSLDHVNVVRGDVRHQQLLERVLGEYEIETVFHLAAQTIVGIANRNPSSTFDTNIAGTWRLLEACRRSPTVGQVVVASSDKAYGEHETLPYTEDAPLLARHPYDVSKACGDMIAQTYAATYDLPVTISRCGNFFGAGDLNWNRLIPGTIRSVLLGQRPVIRSDGQYLRDYFYVEDGAAAYMWVAQRLAAGAVMRGRVYNFSNEAQHTVLDLVRRILSLMRSDLTPDVRNEATHEIRRQHLSAERARSELGWRPLFSVDEGLQHTIDWYKQYFESA